VQVVLVSCRARCCSCMVLVSFPLLGPCIVLVLVHGASGVGVVPCPLLLVNGAGVVPTVGSVHCAGVGA
jgi:hypothetical protein